MMAGKGRSPGGAAHYGSLEDFVVAVGEYPNIDWRQFLLWALKNDDLVARVEIADWMLDHGADPALVRPENNVPFHVMMENVYLSDEELGPFYDVIFSHPGIDWEIRVGKLHDEPCSLQQYVEHFKKWHQELYRRMCDYLENGPSPRPVFS